jgi:hypothetical protein
MNWPLIAGIALAVVAGIWYSYYQSVRKLREHDRETVRLMELDLERLRTSGAPSRDVEEFRRRIEEFRAKHNVR